MPSPTAASTKPTGNGREKAFGERLAELRKRLGKP